MLWGLVILCSVTVALAIALIVRVKRADRIAAKERERRFSIKDTGERVPLAQPRAAEPVPTIAETLPPLHPQEFIPTPPAPPEPEPATTTAGPVTGRLVVTPDGESILTTPPFALREAVFTRRAGRFVNMLTRRVPPWVIICPRVRLDSLLTPTKPDGRDPADWREWRRRVRVRSVDLVLCDRRTWKPIVAVVFENERPVDAHAIAGGQDRMIDEVLTAVGLPLLRLRGEFQRDWPLIQPYVDETILPHMTDEQVLEASFRAAPVDGDATVTLLRMDQDKGWVLE